VKIALLGPYPLRWCEAPNDTPVPGGVDAVVLALARGLARREGLQLSVITAEPGLSAPKRYAGEGYEVWAAPYPRGGRLTGQRQVAANLRAQIDRLAPDIVHAHIAGIYGRAAVESDRPAAVTLHGIIYREMRQAWGWSSWPVRLRWLADARLERFVLSKARHIVAISPYVLAEFRGHTDAAFRLIENPVDDRFFTPLPPPPDADRLLCVARIIPRKGILALIEAFARIRAARPAATLLLAGETDSHPAYVARCHQRAAELGVADAVTFAGASSLDAIQAFLAESDLFLLASEQETAPVSIAEAMASGRPVVTTDVGGCAAMVVDGLGGCVTPPRDARAFADAVIELLHQPARRSEMGCAAREQAQKRFALGPVVDATLDLYRAMLPAGGVR
jgi:glycosyltransferase involved in cell wall biosynthesis